MGNLTSIYKSNENSNLNLGSNQIEKNEKIKKIQREYYNKSVKSQFNPYKKYINFQISINFDNSSNQNLDLNDFLISAYAYDILNLKGNNDYYSLLLKGNDKANLEILFENENLEQLESTIDDVNKLLIINITTNKVELCLNKNRFLVIEFYQKKVKKTFKIKFDDFLFSNNPISLKLELENKEDFTYCYSYYDGIPDRDNIIVHMNLVNDDLIDKRDIIYHLNFNLVLTDAFNFYEGESLVFIIKEYIDNNHNDDDDNCYNIEENTNPKTKIIYRSDVILLKSDFFFNLDFEICVNPNSILSFEIFNLHNKLLIAKVKSSIKALKIQNTAIPMNNMIIDSNDLKLKGNKMIHPNISETMNSINLTNHFNISSNNNLKHSINNDKLNFLKEKFSKNKGIVVLILPKLKEISYDSLFSLSLKNKKFVLQSSICIDFTSSNINYKEESSLHFIESKIVKCLKQTHLNSLFYSEKTETNYDNFDQNDTNNYDYRQITFLNEYQLAIELIKEIYIDCNFDLYGFGANINNNEKYLDKESKFFKISNNKDEELKIYEKRDKSNIDSILQDYKSVLNKLKFDGPTLLSNIISYFKDELISNYFECFGKSFYKVVYIIIDNQPSDIKSLINSIVDSSVYPISIVIIGVGSSKFTQLEELFGISSKLLLVDDNNKSPKRDNCVFITLPKFQNDLNFLLDNYLDFLLNNSNPNENELEKKKDYFNNNNKLEELKNTFLKLKSIISRQIVEYFIIFK